MVMTRGDGNDDHEDYDHGGTVGVAIDGDEQYTKDDEKEMMIMKVPALVMV